MKKNYEKFMAFTLAEVFMANKMSGKKCLHFLSRMNEPKEPTKSFKKLAAFTLAEVLITLAIIGVVAALTIPTVITNYQKKMYATQLKKSYSNIQNGLKAYVAQEGAINIAETTLWSKIQDDVIMPSDLANGNNKEFLDEFSKIFRVVSVDESLQDLEEKYSIKYKNLDGSDAWIPGDVILADGTAISFYLKKQVDKENGINNLEEFQKKYNTPTKFWAYMGWIGVDVNGAKGPNIVGRDLFIFDIGIDGTLYPEGGKDYAIFWRKCNYNDLKSCLNYWNNEGETTYSCPNGNGNGCAGRIMEENWQMNY